MAGGPEGELGVGVVAAVVQGAAEAGGELGEDGLDGGATLLAGLPALVGAEAGGHVLPAGGHGGGVAAVVGPAGLAGLAGDGDVQLGGGAGGEVGVAGVAGVEQGPEDLAGDAGGVQDLPGHGHEGARARVSLGLGWRMMARMTWLPAVARAWTLRGWS